MGGLAFMVRHMNSFTTSAPKEFAVRNAYVSKCSDEQLIAEYSDFVHTSR